MMLLTSNNGLFKDQIFTLLAIVLTWKFGILIFADL